jgi:hypothetical protein
MPINFSKPSLGAKCSTKNGYNLSPPSSTKQASKRASYPAWSTEASKIHHKKKNSISGLKDYKQIGPIKHTGGPNSLYQSSKNSSAAVSRATSNESRNSRQTSFSSQKKKGQPHQSSKRMERTSEVVSEKQLEPAMPEVPTHAKEMELIKLKMAAFVKSYEDKFQKMKEKNEELEAENKTLKKKVAIMSKRRLSMNQLPMKFEPNN